MRKIIQGFLFLISVSLSGQVFSAYAFYGPTVENEHLYRIADRVRPKSSVTIEQMMLAIVRANPNAFVQKNINALKAGYRLQLPSISAVIRISPNEARRIVKHQNRIWMDGMSEVKGHGAKESNSKKVAKKIKNNDLIDVIPSIKDSKEILLTNKKRIDNTSKTKLIDIVKQQGPETPTVATNQQEEKLNAIDSKLNTTIETNKMAIAGTQKQLTALTQQTKLLESKLSQLTAQLQSVTYQVVQLNSKHAQESTNFNRLLFINLKHNSFGLSAALLTLALLTYFLFRTFKPASKRLNNKADSRKGEYDFMGSQESIPAKLDLARAYMDMGDTAAAKTVLKDVLKFGNKEQRQGARDLMGKLT